MLMKTKKIILFILLFLIVLFIPKIVKASSLNIFASSSSASAGEKVNISISTDCIGRFDINVTNGKLNGDSKYWLEASSASFSVDVGQSGTTTVTVTPANPVANSKGENVTLSSKSVNIAINSSSSSGGSSGSSGTSSSNSGSSTSSSAELSMINTSPDFRGFKPSSSGPYYLTVENSVTKIEVSAKSKNGSTYTVSGNTDLQVGTNKVTVTAKKGNSTKEYYIYVTRKASNDEKITPNQIDKDEDEKEEEDKKLRLNNIILDDSLNIKLDPNFDPEIFEYTVILGEDYLDLEEILINAISNVEEAKVTIKGNENLVDGENIVIITVEAKGYETVTYMIKVMKQKVEETVAQPILEINDDGLDNSDEILKKKIIICVLTSLIALIGIIFIAKQCYESTNDQRDYLQDDYEDIPSNQIIHNNYDNNKKDIQEDNILEDIYTKSHLKDSKEEKPLQEEKLQRQEITNKETDEKIDKVSLDEFFNTQMNFYEGKPSRRRGKGKHS